MTGTKHKFGFINKIAEVFKYTSHSIFTNISPLIEEFADVIITRIENRIIRLERKILQNITSMLLFGLGGMFLVLSLFFFLVESIGLSKATAFLLIGIAIILTGLLLKWIDTIERQHLD